MHCATSLHRSGVPVDDQIEAGVIVKEPAEFLERDICSVRVAQNRPDMPPFRMVYEAENVGDGLYEILIVCMERVTVFPADDFLPLQEDLNGPLVVVYEMRICGRVI